MEYEAKKMLLNVNNFTLPEGVIPKFMSKIDRPFIILEQMLKDI